MGLWQIILRFICAMAIGGIIGYERERQKRPAGFITNMLVCIGAATISMIQTHLTEDAIHIAAQHPNFTDVVKVDGGRLISQVVSGIGFIGAGTIIQRGGSVEGLTTAATLWVVACIGIAIGMGYYLLSFISMISVYCALVVLRKLKFRIQDGFMADD